MDQTVPNNPFPPGPDYSPAQPDSNPFPPSDPAAPLQKAAVRRTTLQSTTAAPPANPLTKHFRQPAIYLRLPSQGRWWDDGSLDMPPTGELPVYPMTSKDEITLRTPDALINGQGVVDVIHSCVPAIKNAWKMPSIDVDATLISMRIASYGHKMDFESTCPHCQEQNTYALDLRNLLETVKCPEFDQIMDLDVIHIKFRPQSYLQTTRVNQMNFQLNQFERMIQSMDENDHDNRAKQVSEQVQRLNEMSLDLLTNATEYILDIETSNYTRDQVFIREFYGNIDSKILQSVNAWLGDLVKDANIKAQKVDCAGCAKEMQLEILFDYSTFFVGGF